MFDFLTQSGQKNVIGVTLTPNVGLEAVVYDRNSDTIASYARRKVDYDLATREIRDFDQFKTALSELISEVAPNQSKPMVHLVLPNVLFDFQMLPMTQDFDNTAIREILLSRSEEFYVFKKETPVTGWCDVINPDSTTERRIAFTSFQKSTISEIKDIAAELNFKLIGIETNYSATIRGLYASGLIDDVILEEASWAVLLINNNSYMLYEMDGKNLINCFETPLPIKSFSAEEAYQVITSNANPILSSITPSKLYVVSQTNEIHAEVLKKLLQFDKEIVTIDSNEKYGRSPILDVKKANDYNTVNSMTLAAIGASQPKSNLNFVINILADDPDANTGVYFTTKVMGSVVDVTSELVRNVCLVIAMIAGLILGGAGGGVAYFSSQAEAEASDLQNQINSIQQQIDAENKVETKQEVDMTQVIDKVAEMNVQAINLYDSISSDIPKNIWLTKYYNKNGDRVAVRGIAQSIIDIYEYYKNLRIASPQSDVKLNELKVLTEDLESEDRKYLNNLVINKDTDRLYTFEISNTQIEYNSNKSDDDNKENKKNEYDLLSKPPAQPVEETSNQMVPAK